MHRSTTSEEICACCCDDTVSLSAGGTGVVERRTSKCVSVSTKRFTVDCAKLERRGALGELPLGIRRPLSDENPKMIPSDDKMLSMVELLVNYMSGLARLHQYWSAYHSTISFRLNISKDQDKTHEEKNTS